MRTLKYSIITSIWPNEVQLTLLAVPSESLITSEDYKYLILGGMVVGVVLLVSVYEKVKNTRTMEEIVAGEQQRDEGGGGGDGEEWFVGWNGEIMRRIDGLMEISRSKTIDRTLQK